jgi:hypothetical protein
VRRPCVYYNENDPGAVAWLRELVKKKLIAHGVVDSRSIEDVVHVTSSGSISITSLQVLAAGRQLCVWQDGRITRPFVPGHVRASLSHRQALERGQTITGTYGRPSCTLFRSVSLQSFLASKLRLLMDGLGSPVFKLTWKDWVMPSGLRICVLAASAPRTAETDCISWPTPVAHDDNKTPEAHLTMKTRMGVRDGTGANRTAITSLQVTAKLYGWPGTMRDHDTGKPLPQIASMYAWATPTARDGKDGGSAASVKNGVTYNSLLGRQVWHYGDGTAGTGSLNPEHSRWLMGYPAAWGSCGATAMQSFRSSRRRSSKQ